MSLVCTPSVVPPPPATPDAVIANDGFFPDIDPAQLRAGLRVQTQIPAERLRDAAIGAILRVGNDLGGWKDRQLAAGYATLAEVPNVEIAGEHRLVLLYRRAISSLVSAELIERRPDSSLTPAGEARIEAIEPTVADLRRDAQHAVRDILGRTRTTVELI